MNSLYPIFLVLHSILRWVVILTALFAIIRALTGVSFKRGFMAIDNRAGLWYTTALDLQLLVGIILYFFLSPTITLALQNFGGAMQNAATRYFAVEHVALMFVSVIVAHIGRSLSKKAPSAILKHRRALIWFTIALLILLAAIPWPFLSYGRPWIRF